MLKGLANSDIKGTILNLRHFAALSFWCRPPWLSDSSFLSLQTGSKFATCFPACNCQLDRQVERDRHRVGWMTNLSLYSQSGQMLPTQPNSLQGAGLACLSARISSLLSLSFPPVSLSLCHPGCCYYYRHLYCTYINVLNVQESSHSSQPHQFTESTSLTIASDEIPDSTGHYSKKSYINTEESPKEESQFSCRHHLEASHYSFWL